MSSNDAGTIRLRAASIFTVIVPIVPIVPTGPATGAVPRGALPLAGGRSQ